jgi:hypothetical protein
MDSLMTRIFTHLLLSCALFLMAPTHGQTDDDYLLQLVNQAEPGAHINIDRDTLNLSKKVSFNKKNLGVSVNFNGAKVNLVSSEAGFEIGQSGSGIRNVTISTDSNYLGTAISVVSQHITVRQSKHIQNVTLIGLNQSGNAIVLATEKSNDSISFLQANNVVISGYEYGIKLETNSTDTNAFINANSFSNVIFWGNNTHDLFIQENSYGASEISGNIFNNIQFQYSDVTAGHVHVAGNAKYNQINNVMSWDASGRNKLLFNVGGKLNSITGYVPMSAGTAQFGASTNALLQTDAGNQTNYFKLGERVLENSRSQVKVLRVTNTHLPILDIRDGSFIIDENTHHGQRLTNIRHGKDGQELRIKFSGKTLLSDSWGGVGQFKLTNGSYIPDENEIVQFTYVDGVWYEHG